MAFKRSAVRSRLSPPKPDFFGNQVFFFTLRVFQAYKQQRFDPAYLHQDQPASPGFSASGPMFFLSSAIFNLLRHGIKKDQSADWPATGNLLSDLEYMETPPIVFSRAIIRKIYYILHT